MTTTERIANAIKHILEEDRRESRERIAELERDAAHMQLRVDLALSGDNELHAIIDDLNRQLDEAHKENARLVLENARLLEEVGNFMNDGWPCRSSGTAEPAPVVEEQGPWVVYDEGETRSEFLFAYPLGDGWSWGDAKSCGAGFLTLLDTEKVKAESCFSATCRVITLAEARAIEAKRG
jgi:hypothetical protein